MKNPEVGWVFDPTFSPRGDQVAVYWNRTDGPQRRRGLWVLSWPAREERFIAPNLRPVGWSENGDWIYAFEDVDERDRQSLSSNDEDRTGGKLPPRTAVRRSRAA